MSVSAVFGKMSDKVAKATGSPFTFVASCLCILIWAAVGPLFGFSDTWQLVINTGTTIITFLMVFLIQNTQNRDSAALHAKMDELIRSSAAQNAFIGIEHLPEEEVEQFQRRCEAAKQHADKTLGAVREKATAAADRATSV
jgi:low affinity Fe/Cu permease